MRKPSLGEQELAILRYVAEHGPVSGGEVSEGFGTPRGLTRSTTTTVMERLRRKGYLTRKPYGGVFRYASPVPQEEILGGLVRHFVEKTLAGSLAPFVTYFTQTNKLSPDELAELQRLVAKLEAQREGAGK
jgi:predicted transcriptional regulator